MRPARSTFLHASPSLLLVALALGALIAPSTASAITPVPAIARGTFTGLDHATAGRATVVLGPTGQRWLHFYDFRLAPGPRVRVWLVADSPRGTDRFSTRVDLGPLKAASGHQAYLIPPRVRLQRHRSVLLWCVPFRGDLGRADLRLVL